MILLTSRQAIAMLDCFGETAEMRVSLDLGRSETVVRRQGDTVELSPETCIALDDLRKIADNPDVVFTVQDGQAEKLVRFSEATQRSYRLRATGSWPALEISGILMHRIKDTDPKEDAESKIALIRPVRGVVLDTCCGLGYTATLAAKTAGSVTVVEKDEMVLELARINPYSEAIFQDPKITLVCASVADIIGDFSDKRFDVVIHDPPTLKMAGELYSDTFYQQLARILRPGGKLLHYTGSPGRKHRRVDVPGRVARRLQEFGFGRARIDEVSSCVTVVRKGGGR